MPNNTRNVNLNDTLLTGLASSKIRANNDFLYKSLFPKPTRTMKINFDLIKKDEGFKVSRIENLQRSSEEPAFTAEVEYSKTRISQKRIKINFIISKDVIEDSNPEVLPNYISDMMDAGLYKIELAKEKDFRDLLYTVNNFAGTYVLTNPTQFNNNGVDWIQRLATECLEIRKRGGKLPTDIIFGAEAWLSSTGNTLVRDLLRDTDEKSISFAQLGSMLKTKLPIKALDNIKLWVGDQIYNTNNTSNTNNNSFIWDKKVFMGYFDPNQSLTDSKSQRDSCCNYFVHENYGEVKVRRFKDVKLDMDYLEMESVYKFESISRDLGSLFDSVVP